MNMQNLFSLIRGNKSDDLTPTERLLKRCPGAILEDLRASEEELDECERMIKKAKQKIIKEMEYNNII